MLNLYAYAAMYKKGGLCKDSGTRFGDSRLGAPSYTHVAQLLALLPIACFSHKSACQSVSYISLSHLGTSSRVEAVAALCLLVDSIRRSLDKGVAVSFKSKRNRSGGL